MANYGAARSTAFDPLMLGRRNRAPAPVWGGAYGQGFGMDGMGAAPPSPQFGPGMTRPPLSQNAQSKTPAGIRQRRLDAWRSGAPTNIYGDPITAGLAGQEPAAAPVYNFPDQRQFLGNPAMPQVADASRTDYSNVARLPTAATFKPRGGWRDQPIDTRQLDRGLAGQGMAPAYGPTGQLHAFLPNIGLNYATLPQDTLTPGMPQAYQNMRTKGMLEYIAQQRAAMPTPQAGPDGVVPFSTRKTVDMSGMLPPHLPSTMRTYSYGPGGQVVENIREGAPVSDRYTITNYSPEARAELAQRAQATAAARAEKLAGIRENITGLAQQQAAARKQRLDNRAAGFGGGDPLTAMALSGNPAALQILGMQGDQARFGAQLMQEAALANRRLGLDERGLQLQGDQFGQQTELDRERMASTERMHAAGLPNPKLTEAQIRQIDAETNAVNSQLGLPGQPGTLTPTQQQAAQQSASSFSSMTASERARHAENVAAGIMATARTPQEAEQMLRASGLTVQDIQGMTSGRMTPFGNTLKGIGMPEFMYGRFSIPNTKVKSLLELLGQQQQTPTYDARGNEIPRSPGNRPVVRATRDNPLFAYPPRR